MNHRSQRPSWQQWSEPRVNARQYLRELRRIRLPQIIRPASSPPSLRYVERPRPSVSHVSQAPSWPAVQAGSLIESFYEYDRLNAITVFYRHAATQTERSPIANEAGPSAYVPRPVGCNSGSRAGAEGEESDEAHSPISQTPTKVPNTAHHNQTGIASDDIPDDMLPERPAPFNPASKRTSKAKAGTLPLPKKKKSGAISASSDAGEANSESSNGRRRWRSQWHRVWWAPKRADGPSRKDKGKEKSDSKDVPNVAIGRDSGIGDDGIDEGRPSFSDSGEASELSVDQPETSKGRRHSWKPKWMKGEKLTKLKASMSKSRTDLKSAFGMSKVNLNDGVEQTGSESDEQPTASRMSSARMKVKRARKAMNFMTGKPDRVAVTAQTDVRKATRPAVAAMLKENTREAIFDQAVHALQRKEDNENSGSS